MAFLRSVTSEKTWEFFFKLQLKLSNYKKQTKLYQYSVTTDNREFSLKEQDKINRVTKVYMEENAQVIPQGKAYQLHLKNTQNKAELVD